MMKLSCPKLGLEEDATSELIHQVISGLNAESDSFTILGSEMTYIQALAADNGFIVQFQMGSIDDHFEFDTYISRQQTIGLFIAFLCGDPNWHGELAYSKVHIRSLPNRIGLVIGRFLGGFTKGFQGGRNRT